MSWNSRHFGGKFNRGRGDADAIEASLRDDAPDPEEESENNNPETTVEAAPPSDETEE